MRYARRLGFGDIHTCIDRETGLQSIIAIHSVKRGPAIGGCRLHTYPSHDLALNDVLRLAYMMTLKAAICDLPHGGGKAVILKPKHIADRRAFFQAFGDFVHRQQGDYITAIDVGTSTPDMDAIATRTPYVIGATGMKTGHSNPATHTALGVFRGIEAAVAFKLNRTDLRGLHVAIQGVGQVGFDLMKRLLEAGTTVTVCDPSQSTITTLQAQFPSVRIVALDAIYDVPCDIFAPCALGGTLTPDHVQRLSCQIIAGSANNQFTHMRVAELVQQRNILYAPDFLVNAGGLINAALVYDTGNEAIATQKIRSIYDTCLELFERAVTQSQTPTHVAQQMALERLGE